MRQPSCTHLPSIYAFLHATGGNWRNSIYISCCHCECSDKETCRGFLFVPDADGMPILIPVSLLHSVSGCDIEKEECLTVMTKERFQTLYSLWLDWHTSPTSECILIQMMRECSKSKIGNSFPICCDNGQTSTTTP